MTQIVVAWALLMHRKKASVVACTILKGTIIFTVCLSLLFYFQITDSQICLKV